MDPTAPTMLHVDLWRNQVARWPERGRHILAQFDDRTIVLYQAYSPSIAQYAVEHGRLAGAPGFGLGRMSWVKPNFLWMMYRSGWATKPGQERVLAIRVERAAFEKILASAVWSSFEPAVYPSREEWRAALRTPVRMQWDPDHAPDGRPLERRAIQLGLSGEILNDFASTWIREIEDVTPFVHAQARLRHAPDRLVTPSESVYGVADEAVARKLKLDRP